MRLSHKIILTVFSFAAAWLYSGDMCAQTVIPEGYELADSVVYVPVSPIDTALAGKNILDIMPSRDKGGDSEVNINQSRLITESVGSYISSNGGRTLSGYRVRIFFDNKQSARNDSETALNKFKRLFPDIMAYRIYANPYFKVTVGDFRTKTEAMALLARIKGEFPSAFVVKESIEYPVVDSRNAVIADTVKVLRPKIQ